MESSQSNAASLEAQHQAALAHLKAIVEKAIADGKLARDESEAIQRELWKDGKLTAEELRLVRNTIREYVGDESPFLYYDFGAW